MQSHNFRLVFKTQNNVKCMFVYYFGSCCRLITLINNLTLEVTKNHNRIKEENNSLNSKIFFNFILLSCFTKVCFFLENL